MGRATTRDEIPAAGARAPRVVPGGADFLSALLRALLDETPGGVLVVNGDNEVVTMNEGFAEVWQIDPMDAYDAERRIFDDEILLAKAMEKVADPAGFISRVEELYSDPSQRDHCHIGLRDGRILDRHSGALWSPSGDYVGRVWFFEDITELKRREEALTELAATDELTGIANRRRFGLSAERAFQNARGADTSLSVAILDVDHFKTINDTAGHAAGDELLKACAARWSDCIRDSDLLARVGGDEFAVLMPGVGSDIAQKLAERLRAAAHTVSTGAADGKITPTASIGIATFTPADASIDDVIERADRSLYQAKEAGRDRVGPSLEKAPTDPS